MLGDGITDKVRNFLEQDNLSQGQHQSQAGSGNWTVLNNNSQGGHQRLVETPPISNLKNFNVQQSDSESGNIKESFGLPLGTNFTQLTLQSDLSKRQQLRLNGFVHGHQGFHGRNQKRFQGEDTVSDRHSLASRGLFTLESQGGNAPEQSSAVTRSSERLETAEAPINFDFLGGQQQLMRGQQPGVPQPRPRQQPGFNDIQLWQQRIMLKQLQELQRQQQLQHVDEARQQNSMKQSSADQLPALINGTPVHDPSNYSWTNELMGGESKVASSTPQMFMANNINMVQRSGSPSLQGFSNGLMFSNEQGQGLRSMGFVPQQPDQSLYGTPIASSRGNCSQYSNLQGVSHDSADIFTKAGGNIVEKPGVQTSAFSNTFQGDVFTNQGCMQDGNSVSKHGFQGKNLFGNFPAQSLSSGGISGNFQQLHSLPRNAPVQEYQARHERAGWSGNLQEKATTQAGPSQGLVPLDPTEERILFNSDDNIWDASFGRTGNMGTVGLGNPMEGPDFFNVFPSVQSGSWSALMQSAVAETSSSDTGLQDEWSGLNIQKTELSAGNQPASFNDSGKQQSWVDHNLQAASLTSRPFPLFNDANMSPSSHHVSVFQQSSIKFPFEQIERVQPDSSRDSIQQTPKEGCKWLDRSPQQKPLADGNHQVQPPIHLENSSEGSWAGQIYEQSGAAIHSAEAELNVQNIQGSWSHQQSMPSYNIGGHESLSTSGDATLKIRENENTAQHSQGNDNKRTMQPQRDNSSGMWKADGNHTGIHFPNLTGGHEHAKSGAGISQINREDSHANNFIALPNSAAAKSNQEVNQHASNSHQFDYGKHIVDYSPRYKGNETGGNYQPPPNKIPRVSEPLMNVSDKASVETYEKKQENCYQRDISNDGYTSNQAQQTAMGGTARENLWLSSSDSHASVAVNQKSSGQVGRKVPARRFQYHPMGNLGMNVEPTDTMKQITHSQVLSQQVTRGLKSHEQGYFGQSKFVGHISNNAADRERLHGFQGNMKRPDDVPSRVILPGYAANASSSFDRLTGFYSPNRTAQTSQNMLELLHKVDQSREHNTKMQFDSSDRDPSSEMPDAEASDGSISHVQPNQSSTSQGFGLRLAPPSQRLPVSNHAFSPQNSSQTDNDLNSRHGDAEAGEKGQARMDPGSSVQSLPQEMNQREHWDNKSGVSGQVGNETSNFNMQRNSSKAFTSLPYPRSHLQNQLMSGASGEVIKDQSVNVSLGRLASRFMQTDDSLDGTVSDRSTQSSLPGAGGRMPPFNLASPADASQQISTNSFQRVSGQQIPFPEAKSVSQPSITPGMSQHESYPTMLHNVWNQQPSSGGQPHKVSPNFFPPVNSSNNNLEKSSWTPQKLGEQDTKRGGYGSSEFGICSNSQRFSHGEDQPRKESSWQQVTSDKVGLVQQTTASSQGQESKVQQFMDANHLPSGSLLSQPHQQDIDRGRNGKAPVLIPQAEHGPLQNPAASNREIEAFGRSLKPSHVLHQNYSLLHQVQAMKGVETDPVKRGMKIFKPTNYGPDTQHAAASKAGQQLLYGYNPMVRDAIDKELNATSTKMLSFSSEAREDQNANANSQRVSSQDMVAFGRNDSQNHSSHLSIASSRTEHPQISPQMAPSWFEQYGTFKNGQMLPMYDARRTAKSAAQQFFFGKPSEGFPVHASIEQANAVDSGQVGSIWQSTSTTLVASEHLSPSHSLPADVSEQTLAVVRPKKRKSVTSELLSWHKEVTQGSQRIQNISISELDWAQATNRLIEKMEDEAEMMEDGQTVVRPRRRLILTTQLMQQLLRPAPAAMLSADATSNYENVTYYVARLALGDACSLITCSASGDSHAPVDSTDMTSEKVKSSERIGGQYLFKAMEGFVNKARKLENDFLRLDKRASILDLRVDCQDLERFSVINRFAKFHGRGHADGAETSSSSDTSATAQKAFPQRYVTAHPLPRNLPEGVQCLSL
ncbi:PREDICTED: uncharacterized protein LOC104598940 isoform X2 [Nelumbo nucifera]|uniref:Uncharacterized protein LOC104598940 isoform X2 n=2 Tax=Nelumbo nucifera TaxID=4432 RepID=A0A1U8A087_NELNU|nr:PREDICTED: uncharacterized protein LOC104598940 isoform X2 [Nelumbo nucifera]DAD35022.1 TPA_asm: hypothetical protein HUJ06_005662 [Nelumbo nucifera]